MEDSSPTGFHALISGARSGDRAALDRVLAIMRPHLEALAHMYSDPRRPSESRGDAFQVVGVTT